MYTGNFIHTGYRPWIGIWYCFNNNGKSRCRFEQYKKPRDMLFIKALLTLLNNVRLTRTCKLLQ